MRAGLEHRLARLLLRELGLRAVAGADRAQVDDLRRRVRHPEAVELLVERVEALLEVLAPRAPGSRSPGRDSACRRGTRCAGPRRGCPARPSTRGPATRARRGSRTRRRPRTSAGSASARTRCGSPRRGRPERTAGPGDGGTITGKEPISSATAFACSGPAPPNATSANSRGSWPRCTEITRSAPAMFSLTIRRMPSAASSRPSPIASAIVCTAAFAASTSSAISPPIRSAGRWPRTTLASVTVGSVPPWP